MEQRSANYRVAIVDDEPIQRMGILHLCNWSDYQIEIVGQASNGREALQLLEETRPHVVLTDIVMPVMDGVELTKAVRSRYPDIKVVVLSSYSEYHYVREVFKYGVTDYLLKPKVSAPELIAMIQDLCSDIQLTADKQGPDQVDTALLLAQWLDKDVDRISAEPQRKQLEERFEQACFRVVKASTSLALSRSKWTPSQLEQLIIQLAAEQLSPYPHSCVFTGGELIVLVNFEIQQAAEAESALSRFAQQAGLAIDYMSFVMSRSYGSLDQVKAHNEQLSACLGKLLYFPESALVREEDILFTAEKADFDPGKFIEKLQNFSFDEAIGLLKALIFNACEQQAYDEYSLKRLCQNLIYSALSVFEQLKIPVGEPYASKLKMFKQIDMAYGIAELEHIMTDFLIGLKGQVRQDDSQHSSVILQQIYSYVDEHYAGDISLAEMAAALHVNYSYLSSYFKQRTQENLTSYINRVRISKAKELLLKHGLSISEISRITGFSDHNYFSKVFKKYTGLTPAEYRNQLPITM